MGNWNSTALVPQTHLPSAIHSRFVRRRRATLALHDGFWSHALERPLELRDVHTHIVMFGVQPRVAAFSATASAPHQQHRRLLDTYNYPVVTLETPEPQQSSAASLEAVYPVVSIASSPTAQANETSRTLCRIVVTLFGAPLARCELVDPATSQRVVFTCEGDWSAKQLVFRVQRGEATRRECVAQVYRPILTDDEPFAIAQDSYLLDVAPGVDIALLLLMCAAIEEEAARFHPRNSVVADAAIAQTSGASKFQVRSMSGFFGKRAKEETNRVAVPA